jgi:cytochrome oxidase assembly protein ShyY1
MTSVDPAPGRPDYLRTVRTPRMLLVLALLLIVAAVCARLGMWQLERAQLRGDAVAAERAAELAAQLPADLRDLLAPRTSFRGDLVGQPVVVSGEFGADELLVPGRVLGDRVGYLVLTPLTTDDGAVMAVVRGWVAEPVLPSAPGGPVRVTGYLQAGEAAGDPVPDGQIDAVSPAELVNRWGGPIYTGYLVVSDVEPSQSGVALLPPPTAQGTGANLQNLAYALQWWIFGALAVLLWLRMVRDAARDALSPADRADAAATP